MAELGTVKDIMTIQVLSVRAEDTLDTVAQLFEKYDYDGMPVVGAGNKLMGIITAYEMVSQSSGMHLPTIVEIMNRIAVNQADKKELDQHFGRLKEIKATQIMNPKPMTVTADTPLTTVARLFSENHRVNPMLVVDNENTLLGVVSRYDIIKFFNEKYFQQVVGQAKVYSDPFKEMAKTKSEKEIESAVGELSQEFLLVTKKRPLIWRYIAIATFVAGLVAATALVIKIVQRGG